MLGLGRKLLSDLGGIQKVLIPEKALTTHPHFTDVSTEDGKRKGTCPRPHS
jgi:hypothetical protein